jgi:hypothetical protein
VTSTRDIAGRALAAAGRVRLAGGRDAFTPLCVYDLIVDHFGAAVELRFQALPSLEGMYAKGEHGSVVVVSSLRPSGRQRFTAGHELGHHVFGHGTHLDELMSEERSGRFMLDEFAADCFSGFLLMPKLALLRAFKVRTLDIEHAAPVAMYRIASAFGVGYGTLLGHLSRTLRLLSAERAAQLAKVSPKQIRIDVLGSDPGRELHLVDEHWEGRAIDTAVGDVVLVPSGCQVEGGRVQLLARRADGDLYQATAPGVGRAERGGWAAYIRVARHGFAGRAVFRHEEECDD